MCKDIFANSVFLQISKRCRVAILNDFVDITTAILNVRRAGDCVLVISSAIFVDKEILRLDIERESIAFPLPLIQLAGSAKRTWIKLLKLENSHLACNLLRGSRP